MHTFVPPPSKSGLWRQDPMQCGSPCRESFRLTAGLAASARRSCRYTRYLERQPCPVESETIIPHSPTHVSSLHLMEWRPPQRRRIERLRRVKRSRRMEYSAPARPTNKSLLLPKISWHIKSTWSAGFVLRSLQLVAYQHRWSLWQSLLRMVVVAAHIRER